MAAVKIRSGFFTIEDTDITVDTDAYTANDVVGGLLEFPLPRGGVGGAIHQVRIVDNDDEKAAFTLYLFNAQPSTIADDAAFAPTLADLEKLVAIIDIAAGDYVTLNSNAIAIVDVNPAKLFSTAGDTLYGYLKCTGTPTYTAATDLARVSLECLAEI